MILPIDARTAPIRPKYLESETEVLRNWFIFGGRSDGTVDINDGQQDVIIGLKRESAEAIVKSRDEFLKVVMAILT